MSSQKGESFPIAYTYSKQESDSSNDQNITDNDDELKINKIYM